MHTSILQINSWFGRISELCGCCAFYESKLQKKRWTQGCMRTWIMFEFMLNACTNSYGNLWKVLECFSSVFVVYWKCSISYDLQTERLPSTCVCMYDAKYPKFSHLTSRRSVQKVVKTYKTTKTIPICLAANKG